MPVSVGAGNDKRPALRMRPHDRLSRPLGFPTSAVKESAAEQIELGAAVHLALKELEPIDVPLDGAIGAIVKCCVLSGVFGGILQDSSDAAVRQRTKRNRPKKDARLFENSYSVRYYHRWIGLGDKGRLGVWTFDAPLFPTISQRVRRKLMMRLARSVCRRVQRGMRSDGDDIRNSPAFGAGRRSRGWGRRDTAGLRTGRPRREIQASGVDNAA
jgi:hypothetical protein